MIDPELLSMLRCPIDGRQLELANSELIAAINAAIERGEARDRLDQTVTQPIDGGLVTSGGDRLYPIRSRIPTLVADESISTEGLVVDQPAGS